MTIVRERLAEDHAILFDGAMGTELSRRGFVLDSKTWSASALLTDPQLVRAIHEDYLRAGAEILTANTFRTHRRNLHSAGLGHQPREMTTLAVQLAREACDSAAHTVWVAGSQAPLEDCYRPDRVPNDDSLKREHAEMADNLARAGVDLILVETQNTIREALAATNAAMQTGLPVMVSFACGGNGRLLSGETLSNAVEDVMALQPSAVLVNCLPVVAVPNALAELREQSPHLPIGAYANVGVFDEKRGWIKTGMEQPDLYARAALSWLNFGAKIIGGCCGTTPDHIRQIRNELGSTKE